MKFFSYLFLIIDIYFGLKILFFGIGDKYNSSILVRLLTAVVLVAAGVAAYYFMRYKQENGYALLCSLTPVFLIILYVVFFLMTNNKWN